MEKLNFSSFINNVKEFSEKVKMDTIDTINKIKESEKFKNGKEKFKSVKKNMLKDDLDDVMSSTIEQYNNHYTIMKNNGEMLFIERTRAVDMIKFIEDLINSISNRPKSFDTEIVEIKTSREYFVDAYEFAEKELYNATKSALGAGTGIATGAAFVSIAPSVVMWVATTFGTASTGAAISTLSGAAATNAALAWLGGGALATGGGGIAAGNAFLALAGPIGLSIAGVTLLTSIILFRNNKRKLKKEKMEVIEAVKNNTQTARIVSAQIQGLLDEVVSLSNNLRKQYNDCIIYFGKDFNVIPLDKQIELGVLVNNTKSLAASLSKNI